MLVRNRLLELDSYKFSHSLLYPKDTEILFGYMGSRNNAEFPYTVFAGTARFNNDYLKIPISKDEVEEAYEIGKQHGVNFNYREWMEIIEDHNGILPLKIRAVKEGTPVPKDNVMLTVVNTDERYPWLTTFVETALLRHIWYPSTVATVSHYIKHEILKPFLKKTTDSHEQNLDFMLHDFGARGVSSLESAQIGGTAHLINFKGTDNLSTISNVINIYEDEAPYIPGYSIPATEHSTMTSWGREREKDCIENIIEKYLKPGKSVSVVIDSYDMDNVINNILGKQLKEKISNSGGTFVVRPDSGNPLEVVPHVLNRLGENFGYEINSKGFKMLPDCIRVIQGDGVDYNSIKHILKNTTNEKWAAGNLVFGSGGGLLQKIDRDTNSFAFKISAAKINGIWRDIYKNPIGDRNKRSKKGILGLIKVDGRYKTINLEDLDDSNNLLEVIYENGKLADPGKFEDVRKRANDTSMIQTV